MKRAFTEERNREILDAHLNRGLSLAEIGREVGLTRERVRQILTAAHQPTLTRERQKEATVLKKAARDADRAAKRGSLPANWPHGTAYGYRGKGCRCEDCTRANREYQRSLKGRKPPSHGISGYINYGCRCDVCMEAGSWQNALSRRRRVARQALEEAVQ